MDGRNNIDDYDDADDDCRSIIMLFQPLSPTLFSMDEDGRVVRIDTVSKIVSAGMRIGWISGPAPILENIILRKDNSSGFPSGIAQGILLQLLKHWGPEGLLQQGDRAMNFYKQKAEVALKYVRKYLTGLVEWYEPSGGLFLWVRVLGVKDSKFICEKALDKKLVVVYGGYFHVFKGPSPCIRLSYALPSEEDCEQAIKMLGEIIREVQENKIME
ncbi:hypothetical protein C0Q70_16924 [Pomacea canaliculata]|uniref:Aminotransferase class I/classII large domain-containing protein n=1 Tax=Pomacea canaliculata TaxID=400727 RepID=A0A2T7NR53_POMCA|nr:hypothetical protein C0Q70_16924 [Pomacea canaliculata]